MMSPWVPIIIIAVGGTIAGLLHETKLGAWIKQSSAWIICSLMLLGIIVFIFKAIIYGILSVAGLIAKLFA